MYCDADYTESQPVPSGAGYVESQSMNKLGIPLLLVGLMCSAQGFAATTQQNKMTTCNADASARSLKGDERKTFMSTCLKAAPAPAATQQEKMKTCNATASAEALKGDARKSFMSDCLKKK
ncbi:Phosphate starvation-inducible protein PsiF [Pseudomonas coronafaciens pv. zizaniae]|nr:hypothetical protein ALQ80_05238 [Pseudomonas coronafaciens pv. oryzae]RMM80801.1 Phosphate starvation-inducible protein PsiF [Pseudomonas coronafaciens pv. striafaciens]RMN30347.1 Phosphate starvation-inducible protein PsiF [Pseudomonas coronafaciens pv. zizaniae]RMN97925.1 Phosphate starvation-inducible protein PsiF [Pseudomonas coronafaciens pv. coronafaciens]RMP20173.1 putative phosphate starvation-inducible protein psiF [Pseudomonas coronafaciens pv. atropurpurea]